jgi:sugar lactone lactonase YvrE
MTGERGQIMKIGPHRAGFGESPFWSEADQAVWWIDLHGRAVLKTRDDGATWVFKTPGFPNNNPRAVLPGRDGKLIVALDDRLARFDPADGGFSPIDIALPIPEGHILNDATVDPRGRLIIGALHASAPDDYRGRLLVVGPDAPARIIADGLCVPNGAVFAPDGKTLYFSDSHRDVRTVWRAAYDADTGDIASRAVFVPPERFPGRPDGAAMDVEGGYWIAALETGKVLRFTPDGALDRQIELPVPMPSKPCFGGPGMDELYVTTAGPLSGLDDGHSGALFRTAVKIRGAPWRTCAL